MRWFWAPEERYHCPYHGTDCYDTEDDLGNYCEFGQIVMTSAARRGVVRCREVLTRKGER